MKRIVLSALFSTAMLFSAFAQQGAAFTPNGNSYSGTPQMAPTPRGNGCSPIGISIVQPVQFPSADWDINGIRLNILAGQHNNTAFIDLGVLANFTDGDMNGAQLAGIWNDVTGFATGLQIAGIVNKNASDTTGLQIACFNFNNIEAETHAIQIGLFNFAGDTEGVQIGVFNQTESMSGLQLGVFNLTNSMNGIQIGLCNVIRNSTVPVFIGLNMSFY